MSYFLHTKGALHVPRLDSWTDRSTHMGVPVILVIKKNGSVLKNLLKWVLHVRGEDVGEAQGKSLLFPTTKKSLAIQVIDAGAPAKQNGVRIVELIFLAKNAVCGHLGGI